jgi:hypothetical protein
MKLVFCSRAATLASATAALLVSVTVKVYRVKTT